METPLSLYSITGWDWKDITSVYEVNIAYNTGKMHSIVAGREITERKKKKKKKKRMKKICILLKPNPILISILTKIKV